MKKLIIFDFDGVLLDSLGIWYFINKAAAAKLGKHLSKTKYLDSFLGNVHAGLKDVLNLSTRETLDFSAHKRRLIKSFYKPSKVKFFSFAPDLITRLSLEFDLYIVTSSPEPAVRRLLRANKLERIFKKIYGLNKHGKRHALRELINNHPKGSPILITDTIGDIKEARVVGIPALAVGWGFHTSKQLRTAKPQKLILKPEQLRSLFK